jgi:hypothetical protein
LAFTADRGWHLASIDIDMLLACEVEGTDWVAERDHQPPATGRPAGAETVQLMPCGTRSAAVRHRRRGEPIDDACAAAEKTARAVRARRAARTREGAA